MGTYANRFIAGNVLKAQELNNTFDELEAYSQTIENNLKTLSDTVENYHKNSSSTDTDSSQIVEDNFKIKDFDGNSLKSLGIFYSTAENRTNDIKEINENDSPLLLNNIYSTYNKIIDGNSYDYEFGYGEVFIPNSGNIYKGIRINGVNNSENDNYKWFMPIDITNINTRIEEEQIPLATITTFSNSAENNKKDYIIGIPESVISSTGTILQNNQDLDAIVENGDYYYFYDEENKIINYPEELEGQAVSYYLKHNKIDENNIYQEIYIPSNQMIYNRFKTGETWRDWYPLTPIGIETENISSIEDKIEINNFHCFTSNRLVHLEGDITVKEDIKINNCLVMFVSTNTFSDEFKNNPNVKILDDIELSNEDDSNSSISIHRLAVIYNGNENITDETLIPSGNWYNELGKKLLIEEESEEESETIEYCSIENDTIYYDEFLKDKIDSLSISIDDVKDSFSESFSLFKIKNQKYYPKNEDYIGGEITILSGLDLEEEDDSEDSSGEELKSVAAEEAIVEIFSKVFSSILSEKDLTTMKENVSEYFDTHSKIFASYTDLDNAVNSIKVKTNIYNDSLIISSDGYVREKTSTNFQAGDSITFSIDYMI